MTIPLIKTNDKKKALTLKEVKEVETNLNTLTEIKVTATDYKFIDGKRVHFYVYRIKKFPTYPQFIGIIHSIYGRGIEIETCYVDDTYMDLYIRGYSKELR